MPPISVPLGFSLAVPPLRRRVQLPENPVQRQSPLARVDFGFDRGERLDFQNLRQQESKRTQGVSLELRRAELDVAMEHALHPAAIRLALQHAFIRREPRLLEPRGRHLRARDNAAGSCRGTRTLDEESKQARLLGADVLRRHEAQVRFRQDTLPRRHRIEFVVGRDPHRFGQKQSTERRRIGTWKQRLPGRADGRVTQGQAPPSRASQLNRTTASRPDGATKSRSTHCACGRDAGVHYQCKDSRRDGSAESWRRKARPETDAGFPDFARRAHRESALRPASPFRRRNLASRAGPPTAGQIRPKQVRAFSPNRIDD